MFWFSLASLSPLALLICACLWAGIWPGVALAYMILCVYALDRLGRRKLPVQQDAQTMHRADLLSVTLALGHLGLLPALMIAIPQMPMLQAVLTGAAAGLFMGQVSHPNAHELIHRPARGLRRLGAIVYTSMLIGHHVSAHMLVHHVHVGTERDPNSADLGLGFYRFWPRAWLGSFRAGWQAETSRRLKRTDSGGMHPYFGYLAGAGALILLATALAGLDGVLVLLAICTYAQAQIFLADYVQHYGLRRQTYDQRLEPTGPQHSWNAPHWYSSALMLNAPRHSDHHMHPGRPYPALELTKDMPTLPRPVPLMAVIALFPPLWRRIMDPRVALLRQRAAPDSSNPTLHTRQ